MARRGLKTDAGGDEGADLSAISDSESEQDSPDEMNDAPEIGLDPRPLRASAIGIVPGIAQQSPVFFLASAVLPLLISIFRVGSSYAPQTELLAAVKDHRNGRVKDLLCRAGMDPETCGKALLQAATHNNAEAVEILLEHGANPDFVESEDGYGALYTAASEGNLEIARQLLRKGACADGVVS
jgi:hypothetical protein